VVTPAGTLIYVNECPKLFGSNARHCPEFRQWIGRAAREYMQQYSENVHTTLYGNCSVSRSFRPAGGSGEHYLSIKAATASADLQEQLVSIREGYREILKALRLEPETAVFRRIFLSDILNQMATVRDSGLVDDATATSVVQQPPLSRAKVEMLAYHLDGPMTKRRLSPRHLLVEKNGQRHLWSTRLCGNGEETANSVRRQTHQVFTDLIRALDSQGATLRDNCVRTWIYVKGVDFFYADMVKSRRDLFLRQGLTDRTHYIASTGIEGACADAYDLVAMDAYSNLDLVAGQVSYLNDLDRLCPTIKYDVTFERGTQVAYADRAHCFISGTASIDKLGQVVHQGNVMRQLERTLDNVDALLKSGSAALADMMYLIVYLRDPSDFAAVDAYFRERFPFQPVFIVQGAVCRPGWLVEVEGVAVAPNAAPGLPGF
jgi:enamine deaminase RidA (YjgF/YER057c/UK114 family)